MSRKALISAQFLSYLDVIALLAWGVLLLVYWLSGRLTLLIHPNYIILTVATGVALLSIGCYRGWQLWVRRSKPSDPANHMALLPKGWSSSLLIAIAIAGLIVTPRAFASQTALQRGLNDSLTLTRVKPQSFRSQKSSQDKTLIEWIRTIQVYPEPDAYTNQAAKIEGFVVHPDKLGPEYLLLTRFVITCCAADVYPVSLPVKLASGTRADYPVDQWFVVEGKMATETLDNKRQLIVQATTLKPIPEPKDPYAF